MACRLEVIQGQSFYAHWKADKLLHVAVVAVSYFSLSSKRSEVICAQNDKNAFLSPHCRLTPNCYATPSNISTNLIPPESRLRGLHLLPLIVCVYLLSNFRSGLRKTHDRRRAVRFDPSRSSEVDDFCVI